MLVVSPVTFKIRKQKYQVLLFFMRLDDHIIKQSCLKSTIFEDKFATDQFSKHGNGNVKHGIGGDGAPAGGQSENDDEFSSHDYVNLEPIQEDYMEEFDDDQLRFQEDDSSYAGENNLEIIKRKKEIAARLDQKINAIKAKKSMKTQLIPSAITPSK